MLGVKCHSGMHLIWLLPLFHAIRLVCTHDVFNGQISEEYYTQKRKQVLDAGWVPRYRNQYCYFMFTVSAAQGGPSWDIFRMKHGSSVDISSVKFRAALNAITVSCLPDSTIFTCLNTGDVDYQTSWNVPVVMCYPGRSGDGHTAYPGQNDFSSSGVLGENQQTHYNVQNYGADCGTHCANHGPCQWCGQGMCCRDPVGQPESQGCRTTHIPNAQTPAEISIPNRGHHACNQPVAEWYPAHCESRKVVTGYLAGSYASRLRISPVWDSAEYHLYHLHDVKVDEASGELLSIDEIAKPTSDANAIRAFQLNCPGIQLGGDMCFSFTQVPISETWFLNVDGLFQNSITHFTTNNFVMQALVTTPASAVGAPNIPVNLNGFRCEATTCLIGGRFHPVKCFFDACYAPHHALYETVYNEVLSTSREVAHHTVDQPGSAGAICSGDSGPTFAAGNCIVTVAGYECETIICRAATTTLAAHWVDPVQGTLYRAKCYKSECTTKTSVKLNDHGNSLFTVDLTIRYGTDIVTDVGTEYQLFYQDYLCPVKYCASPQPDISQPAKWKVKELPADTKCVFNKCALAPRVQRYEEQSIQFVSTLIRTPISIEQNVTSCASIAGGDICAHSVINAELTAMVGLDNYRCTSPACVIADLQTEKPAEWSKPVYPCVNTECTGMWVTFKDWRGSGWFSDDDHPSDEWESLQLWKTKRVCYNTGSTASRVAAGAACIQSNYGSQAIEHRLGDSQFYTCPEVQCLAPIIDAQNNPVTVATFDYPTKYRAHLALTPGEPRYPAVCRMNRCVNPIYPTHIGDVSKVLLHTTVTGHQAYVHIDDTGPYSKRPPACIETSSDSLQRDLPAVGAQSCTPEVQNEPITGMQMKRYVCQTPVCAAALAPTDDYPGMDAQWTRHRPKCIRDTCNPLLLRIWDDHTQTLSNASVDTGCVNNAGEVCDVSSMMHGVYEYECKPRQCESGNIQTLTDASWLPESAFVTTSFASENGQPIDETRFALRGGTTINNAPAGDLLHAGLQSRQSGDVGSNPSIDGAALALNSDESLCSRTPVVENPWWRVDLDDVYLVERVDITTELDADGSNPLGGGRVGLSLTDDHGFLDKAQSHNSSQFCGPQLTTQHGNPDLTIVCQSGVLVPHARYVWVQASGSRSLPICNIRVIGKPQQNSVQNDNSDTICFRKSCNAVKAYDYDERDSELTVTTTGGCDNVPSRGTYDPATISAPFCVPRAYKIIDNVQVEYKCPVIQCVPGELKNGARWKQSDGQWLLGNNGANPIVEARVYCSKQVCPRLFPRSSLIQNESNPVGVFGWASTTGAENTVFYECTNTRAGDYCRPQVDGYICPSVLCLPENVQEDIVGNTWAASQATFYPNLSHPVDNSTGGVWTVECVQTMQPTRAPTMGYPLAESSVQRQSANLSVGFTCSSHPHQKGGRFLQNNCSVTAHATSSGTVVTPELSFCHPTDAALQGTDKMYPWAACPVGGCSGTNEYCVYGEFSGSSDEAPSYVGSQSRRRANPAQSPNNVDLEAEAESMHLQNVWTAWYQTLSGERCGCANVDYSYQWYHFKDLAEWQYCDTHHVSEASCKAAVTSLLPRGTIVSHLLSGVEHVPGCSARYTFVEVKSPAACSTTTTFHPYRRRDIMRVFDAASPGECAQRCYTGHQNPNPTSRADADRFCNWQCYLLRYKDLRLRFGSSGKDAESAARSFFLSEGGGFERKDDCTCSGIRGGCMAWMYNTEDTPGVNTPIRWAPACPDYDQGFDYIKCRLMASQLENGAEDSCEIAGDSPEKIPCRQEIRDYLGVPAVLANGVHTTFVDETGIAINVTASIVAPMVGCSVAWQPKYSPFSGELTDSYIKVFYTDNGANVPDPELHPQYSQFVDSAKRWPPQADLYCENRPLRLDSGQCALLVTAAPSVNNIQVPNAVSTGRHMCNTVQLDDPGCHLLEEVHGILSDGACATHCSSITECNALEHKGTKCNIYTCSQLHNLPQRAYDAKVGWTIQVRGYVPHWVDPSAFVFSDDSGSTIQSLVYPTTPGKVVCETPKPVYFPAAGAANVSISAYRFRESCPSGYSEIATEAACKEAGRYVLNAHHNHTFEVGLTPICGVFWKDEMLPLIHNVQLMGECAQRCYENWQCMAFNHTAVDGICALFSSCRDQQSGTSLAWGLTRLVPELHLIPPDRWNEFPPGCMVVQDSGEDSSGFWVMAFNRYRNLLTWDTRHNGERPHEMPDVGNRSAVLPKTVDVFRRVCFEDEGVTWPDGNEERGAGWHTTTYGQTQNLWAHPTNAYHFSLDGLSYAMSVYHGAACDTGYVPIQTTTQCRHAARALSSHRVRTEPYSMHFRGETWYLVRHTCASCGWHADPATGYGDDLQGSQTYGTYIQDPGYNAASFSVPFGNSWTKLMFSSGKINKKTDGTFEPSLWMTIDKADRCFMHTLGYNQAWQWQPEVNSSAYPDGGYPYELFCRTQPVLSAGISDNEGPTPLFNWEDPILHLLEGDTLERYTTAAERATLSNTVLYMERDNAGNSLFPVPEHGANVWVNRQPSDGFIFARAAQVPGCSADTPLASYEEMRAHDMYWHEPFSSSSAKQFADGMINFNSMEQWLPEKRVHGFDPFEMSFWQRSGADGNLLSHSWMHGQSICVAENQLLARYKYLGEDSSVDATSEDPPPQFLIVNSEGMPCPGPEYRFIENLDQCIAARNQARNSLSGYVVVDGEDISSRVSRHFIDPIDFSEYVATVGNVSIERFVSGCMLIPEMTIAQTYPDSITMAGGASVSTFELLHHRFTLNPYGLGPSTTPQFLYDDNENSRLRGHAVCVRNTSWVPRDESVIIDLLSQATAVDTVGVVTPVLERFAQPLWKLLNVTFLLSDAAASLPDGFQLSTEIAAYIKATLQAAFTEMTAVHTDLMTIACERFESLSAVSGRRMLATSAVTVLPAPPSSSFTDGIVVDVSFYVKSHELEQLLVTLDGYLRDQGRTGMLGVIQGIDTLQGTGSILSVLSQIHMLVDESKTPIGENGILRVDTAAKGIEGIVNLTIDVDLATNTNRMLWWQSRCVCDAHAQTCNSAQALDFTEYRVTTESVLTNTMALGNQLSANSIGGCVEQCKNTPKCLVMIFLETIPPAATTNTSRCRYYESFHILPTLVPSGEGGARVRIRSNACSMVHVDDVQICQSADTSTGVQTTTTTECMDLNDHHVREGLYFSTSSTQNNEGLLSTSATSVLQVGSTYADTDDSFSLLPHDNSEAAISRCWSHPYDQNHTVYPEYYDRVECKNGQFVAMVNTTVADGRDCVLIGSWRLRCPPVAPFMCTQRTDTGVDYHCAADATVCDSLGGLLPCSKLAYDMAGAPAFEEVDMLALARTGNPPEYLSSYIEPRRDTAIRINSVSRCGGEFVPHANYSFVVFDANACINGFACCNEAGVTNVTAASSACVCPALAPDEHLAVYGGRFADTCHLPVSTWPKCISECIAMGDECLYYMRKLDDTDCLLCHSASGTESSNTSQGWNYHSVKTPAVRDKADQLTTVTEEAYQFMHKGGNVVVADNNVQLEGDWYCFRKNVYTQEAQYLEQLSTNSTCPMGYHGLVYDPGAGDDTTESEVITRVHCERAANAFADTNEELCQYTRCAVDYSCDCSRPAGCSVSLSALAMADSTSGVFQYSGVAGAIGVTGVSETHVFAFRESGCCSDNGANGANEVWDPNTHAVVCKQTNDAASTLETQTWMRCSEMCSANSDCTHWAWDTAPSSRKCVLLDNNANSNNAIMAARMEVQGPYFASPFGTSWLAGMRAFDPAEYGEGAFRVASAKVFRNELTSGMLEHIHYESYRSSVKHTAGEAGVDLINMVTPPSVNYLSMFESSNEVVELSQLSEVWPAPAWANSNRSEVWRVRPYVHTIDSAHRGLEPDINCWARDPPTMPAMGDASAVLVAHWLTRVDRQLGSFVVDAATVPTGELSGKFAISFFAHQSGHGLPQGGGNTPAGVVIFGDMHLLSAASAPMILVDFVTEAISMVVPVCTGGECDAFQWLQLDTALPVNHWNHFAILCHRHDTFIRTITLMNGIVVGNKTHTVSSTLTRQDVSALPFWGLQAVLPEPVGQNGAGVSSLQVVYHATLERVVASTAGAWSESVRERISLSATECTHSIFASEAEGNSTSPYRERFVLINPHHNVFEDLVWLHAQSMAGANASSASNHSNASWTPLVMADASDPSRTTFEWQRADCEPQGLGDGYYSFEAVFVDKISSPLGLYGDVVAGNYTPRWLDICAVEDSGNVSTVATTFYPYVYRNGAWHPICGHGFAETGVGADAVCKAVGFESGTAVYIGSQFDTAAVAVGACYPDETLDQCTAGQNAFFDTSGSLASCGVGQPVGVQVQCTIGHNTTQYRITSCSNNVCSDGDVLLKSTTLSDLVSPQTTIKTVSTLTSYEPCLTARETPVEWYVSKQSTGGLKMRILSPSVTHTNSTEMYQFTLDVEPDNTTTFPETYQLHVNTVSEGGGLPSEGLLVTKQVDVNIVLGIRPAVHLLQPLSLSCYGNCASTPRQGTSFTLVNRLSLVATGALTDEFHPGGDISVVPTMFTNGSEMHTWAVDKCTLPGTGALYSLSTGRCLVVGGDDVSRYGSCETTDADRMCWVMQRAKVPHETLRRQSVLTDTDPLGYYGSSQAVAGGAMADRPAYTLSFDDSVLWPHEKVVAPPRNRQNRFLQNNTITDIMFRVSISPSDRDALVGSVVTPVRFYLSDGQARRPVSSPECMAKVPTLHPHDLDTYACLSTCLTSPVHAAGNTTTLGGVTYPLATCDTAAGEGVCMPSCYPTVSSWSDTQDRFTMDMETVETAVGFRIRRRLWTSEQRLDEQRCLSSSIDPLDPDALQFTSCADEDMDYFEVYTSTGHTDMNEQWAHPRPQLVRSVTKNKCIGVDFMAANPGMQLDQLSGVRLRLVSCTTTPLLGLAGMVNLFRDDAAPRGRTGTLENNMVVEPLLKYTDDFHSASMLYYRHYTGGMIRVVVRLDGASEVDPVSTNPPQLSVVSLVDDSGMVAQAPDSHAYTMRVKRTGVGTPGGETRVFMLIRNGTVVDLQEYRVMPNTAVVASLGDVTTSEPRRGVIAPAVASAGFEGSLSFVSMQTFGATNMALADVDDSRIRFASGKTWRVYNRANSISMQGGGPSDCAQACRVREACRAARWSSMQRLCELLSKCSDTRFVSEGHPNTLNLHESPWHVYNKSLETDGGTHLLLHPTHRLSPNDTTGGMIVTHATQARASDPIKATIGIDSLPNTHLFPNKTDLFAPVATGTGRRLQSVGTNWAETWYNKVTPVEQQVGAAGATTLPSSAYLDGVAATAQFEQFTAARPGFPQVIKHTVGDTTDVICSDAFIFVLSGVFKSTTARYGYRNLMSAASEAGTGGAQLLLSPDGHLKDKISDVSVATHGDDGCVAVVVVDCDGHYRVSVNGRVVHYEPVCPFDLQNKETLMHAWQGRREVMCLAPSGERLGAVAHAELVAYFQLNIANTGDVVCGHQWDADTRDTLDKRMYVLPKSWTQTIVHEPQAAWQTWTADTTATILLCKDPVYCTHTSSALEIYKIALGNDSSPFALISNPTTTAVGATPQVLMAFTEASPHPYPPRRNVIWQPVASYTEVKAHLEASQGAASPAQYGDTPQLIPLILGTPSVDIETERQACGVNVTHGALQYSFAGACTCSDNSFTEWVDASHDYSNTCGVCETTLEVDSHPQYTPEMKFIRRTGATIALPGATTAERWVMQSRLRLPNSGCADWELGVNLVDTDTTEWLNYTHRLVKRPCHNCPRDCQFQSMGPDDQYRIFSPLNTPPCTRQEACGFVTPRRCVVMRVVKQPGEYDIGGKTCEQVMIEDFHEIAKHTPLQSFFNASNPRGVYNPLELGSLIWMWGEEGNPLNCNDIDTACPNTLAFTMLQHEIYPADDWAWLSAHMWERMAFSESPCDALCSAKWCRNIAPYSHIAHTVEEKTANWNVVSFVLGLVVLTLVAIVFFVVAVASPQTLAWIREHWHTTFSSPTIKTTTLSSPQATPSTSLFSSNLARLQSYFHRLGNRNFNDI